MPDSYPIKFRCPLCKEVAASCTDASGVPFFVMRHYQSVHKKKKFPSKIVEVSPGVWTVPKKKEE